MKPEEIAAYIGAAAWLPPITTWLYKFFIRPKLRVVPEQFGEVGFTRLGPIFNIRMAFFVENRDIIIHGIELTLRHEDGESRSFRWAGLAETISEITDASGNRQIVSRDQAPIAVKISPQTHFEKFVRFQEPRFDATDGPVTQSLVAHFNYLKQKNAETFVLEVLDSKEFFTVVEARKKWFWWKQGRYTVEIKPSSPQVFKLIDSSFDFELSSVDIDRLKKNIPAIDTELRNVISSNLNDFKPQPLNWQWANVRMLRSIDK
jgi:hypothetical protein